MSEEDEGIWQALTQSGGQDFKYLGLGYWCEKLRDIVNRKALGRTLNKAGKILKSRIEEKLKLMLFRATTETILLYCSQTWSLTVAEEKSLWIKPPWT